MAVETVSLVVMTLIFLFAWIPHSVAKALTYGGSYVLSNRDETGLGPLPAWGQRANRAYENLKSNFPAFAVAILFLASQGKTDAGIQTAALIYVLARLGHFAVYTAGWVAPRPVFWCVGLVANGYLLLRIL